MQRQPAVYVNNKKYVAGFTLIELLIVVTITAILFTLAIPSFKELRSNTQAKIAKQQILSELRMARHEAMNSGRLVTLCPVGQKNQCGDEWVKGQLLKDKRNVIKIFPALPQGELTWKGFPAGSRLVFSPGGFMYLGNGSFRYYANGQQVWRISVSRLGRVRVL